MTIRANVVTPKGLVEHKFDSIEAFVQMLSELRDVAQMVVRCPDDESFLAISGACVLSEQAAQRAVSLLAGGRAPFWRNAQAFPDGDGWRMVLMYLAMNSQVQPQQNGLLR